MMNKKSTENTVFVRFHPPSSLLRRHHIENHFSQVGPIKKASLIIPKKPDEESGENTNKPSSYGFIKYTCEADAVAAAERLNRSTLELPPGEQQTGEPKTFQVKVELASTQVSSSKQQDKQKGGEEEKEGNEKESATVDKKHNRIILRNLSFYAKESHIQDAMKQFGPLVEVNLPKVDGKSRGFAFCTFASPKDAKKAIDACHKTPLQIKQRNVQVDWSLAKAVHQKQKEEQQKLKRKQEYQDKVRQETKAAEKKKQENAEEEEEEEDSDDNDSSSSDSDDDGDSGSDDDSKSEDSDNDGDSNSAEASEEEDDNEEKEEEDKQLAIEEQRELFVRNLPFDSTRHDIFETFRKYGKIAAIYLVSDPKTGLPRGTAFITYEKHAAAERAMKASNKNAPTKKGNDPAGATMPTSGLQSGISLKGRPLLVDYAVDKETANTLKRDTDQGGDGSHNKHQKDKRNLYLKGEGRVDDDAAWQALGEQDQAKRQRAWADKTTKLKSPLFFINPNRLSIRNLSKSVDEGALKQLLFDATQRGLEKRLVSVRDLAAQWTAAGEMSQREVLEQSKAIKTIPEEENVLKPAFLDEKNTKKTIPSVFLDRDFDAVPTNKNKTLAPSRGFAFAEFEHHVHALACLRELNNNPAYSESYAAGGKAAANAASAAKKRRHKKKKSKQRDEGIDAEAIKVPRLIVEFTVENKAKARQQADHRARQQANRIKQKLEHKEKKELAALPSSADGGNEEKKSKKRGRGAKQREKKRQRRLQGEQEDGAEMAVEAAESKPRKFHHGGAAVPRKEEQREQPKGIKPPKKQKRNKELEAEEKFSKLVDKFKADFVGAGAQAAAKSVSPQKKVVAEGKRWFD
jgi:nucleolar protein 4